MNDQYTARFDQRADRSGDIFWLKPVLTPDVVHSRGLLGYAGAEFEFATCPAFCRGVEQAAQKGVFGFTLPYGKYSERTKWWLKTVRNYEVEAEWIVPTHGTIFSLATCIRMVTQPGEAIIMLTPGYNRYEQAARRLGRKTVMVPFREENGAYRMDWDALESAMAREENKILVLCHPNNPTGHLYSREELARVAALSKRYQVLVFSDEIFADVTFSDRIAVPYTSVAGKDALAITCVGLGKTFSLTGVNHANLIIENDALRERIKAQRDADHYGSVDPMLFAGLTAAYTPEGLDWLCALREYVRGNYELLRDFMKKRLPEAVVTEPEGTYVVWINYEKTGLSPEGLKQLLEEEGLFAGDAGDEYFGSPLCMRYSIAVPRGELERALDRLAAALDAREGATCSSLP